MLPSADLIALARAAAAAHELDPALVCAVVEQESAWDTHAIRYEPGFRTRYVAPLGLPPTEEVARSISWGLMQVMGQVAREHGFGGKFLSALCDPAVGLDIGCAVLDAKLAIRSGSPSRGSNATEGSLPQRELMTSRALSNFGTAARTPTTPRKSSHAWRDTNERAFQKGIGDPLRIGIPREQRDRGISFAMVAHGLAPMVDFARAPPLDSRARPCAVARPHKFRRRRMTPPARNGSAGIYPCRRGRREAPSLALFLSQHVPGA